MSKKSAFVFISICTVLYVFVFRWLWFWTFYSCSVNTSTFCVDVFNFKNVSPSENVAWKRQCKRALNLRLENGFILNKTEWVNKASSHSEWTKQAHIVSEMVDKQGLKKFCPYQYMVEGWFILRVCLFLLKKMLNNFWTDRPI